MLQALIAIPSVAEHDPVLLCSRRSLAEKSAGGRDLKTSSFLPTKTIFPVLARP